MKSRLTTHGSVWQVNQIDTKAICLIEQIRIANEALRVEYQVMELTQAPEEDQTQCGVPPDFYQDLLNAQRHPASMMHPQS